MSVIKSLVTGSVYFRLSLVAILPDVQLIVGEYLGDGLAGVASPAGGTWSTRSLFLDPGVPV